MRECDHQFEKPQISPFPATHHCATVASKILKVVGSFSQKSRSISISKIIFFAVDFQQG
jgi:hypothetical protein